MAQPVEIIDAQVHLNQIVSDWRTAPIDSTIATGIQAMDAVGVHKVLIAESRNGVSLTVLPTRKTNENRAGTE